MEIHIDDATQLFDIKNKCYVELRSAMVAARTKRIEEWAEIAKDIDTDQRGLREYKERQNTSKSQDKNNSKKEWGSILRPGTGDRTTQANQSEKKILSTKPLYGNYQRIGERRPKHNDLAIERLLSAGVCVNCGAYGHRKWECTKDISTTLPQIQINTLPEHMR